jgi:hypothetical protein
LILTGVINRGQDDFEVTESGCLQAIRTTASETDPSQFEEMTYAFQAVAGLCDADPKASSICRQDCGDPCQALPHPAYAGGCSVMPGQRCPERSELAMMAALLAAGLYLFNGRARARSSRDEPARSGVTDRRLDPGRRPHPGVPSRSSPSTGRRQPG